MINFACPSALLVFLAASWGCGNMPPPKTKVSQPALEAVQSPAKIPPPGGPAWFREVTSTSGLDFSYKTGEEANHFTMLEVVGGGVALFDFDRDGKLDVFLAGGGTFEGPDKKQIVGRPCKLYRNLGDWKFADVSSAVGLDSVSWWYTHGLAVADYDRDGWPDLAVTGYGKTALFQNESDGQGGRRFTDVTKLVSLVDNAWGTSAGWGDLNGDGFPDLYVCHYLDWSFDNHPICPGYVPGVKQDNCSPQRFQPLRHSLFRNEKGLLLQDVSEEHGFKAEGKGLGVLLADLNDDGRPDAFVANDTNPDFLYLNRGDRLEERALPAGVAADENGHPTGSMGVDAGDFDGSGRPSLWVTVFQHEQHSLFRNLGQEVFQHQSQAAGTAALGTQFVGFGTGFFDFDNDGWEDLVIANGHVFRVPSGSDSAKQQPVLLHNLERRGRRVFEDAGRHGGKFFQTPEIGRGLAIGDLDNDGWPDLVVCHSNRSVALLRNEAAAGQSRPHNWLGVQMIGKNHRDVVGSTITLELPDRKLTRFAKGGGSYLSAGDPRLLFGLGVFDQPVRLTVKWAWGSVQTWEGVRANQYWELREGEADAKSLAN